MDEDEQSGRPSISRSKSLITEMKNVIHGNQLTVPEVADEVGISIGSCHTILAEDLGTHEVSKKLVPRLLTDDLLQRANDENLLKNVITGDNTWVYNYDTETKKQSSH